MQQKNIIIIVILIVALLGLSVWYTQMGNPQDQESEIVVTNKQFDSLKDKVAFEYPSTYNLEEHDMDISGLSGTVLVLQQSGASVPQNSEAPPGITISIFENTQNLSLGDFLQKAIGTTPAPTGGFDFQETTIDEKNAIAYTSTGLYESDNIAIAHAGKVYIFSASWLTRDDQTLTDLNSILQSIQFK